MQILRIAQKAYPDVTGGGAYHVHALSRDQASMGHDVTVVTVGNGPHQEQRDGYEIRRYHPRLSLLGNDIAPGVWRTLRGANEYDVVHAHSHLYFSTNLAAINRWLGRTPLAITNHGLYSQTAPAWLFDLYLQTGGRWTFDRADVVFCYTNADARRLRDRGIETRIEVVSNGIDTDRFTPHGPESDRISGEEPTALFVGRLVEGKRPTAALRAFADAKTQHPEITFAICGDGPLRDELERLAADLGISSSVRFLGQVQYDEMPAVYRSADVLVLPSRTEGLPRTVLEGIASGLPVVCSELDQLVDLVGHDERGELVALEDDGALGRALARWIGRDAQPDPLTDTYSWETTVEDTTDALRSLVYCK